MKQLLTLLFLLTAATAAAQDIASFRRRLAEPVRIDSLRTEYNTVRVEECGDAADIVARSEQSRRKSVNGYRIVIFMSNAQSARTEALAARESFETMYPDERSYVTYENPYFKVAVGNCTSQEEAIMLMERIRPTFPKAFLMRETIPASELVQK